MRLVGGYGAMRTSTAKVARHRLTSLLAVLGSFTVFSSAVAAAAFADDARSHQWYLDRMQADSMWKVSAGQGVTVAVIDGEADASRPELQGQLLPAPDLNTGKPPGVSDDGHGTEMAALIAGTGAGGGIQGLAPRAKILPLKYYVVPFGGEVIPKYIRYAVDHGARIINMSFGDLFKGESPDMRSAVDYANSKGALMFAASGNDGDKANLMTAPASMYGVVAVGAVDKNLTVTKWSTHGPQVALAAPGDDIPMHCPNGQGLCSSWGTSQATAIASASAALVWSAHPDWTGDQVLRALIETAGKPQDGKVPSQYLGYGIVRPRMVLLDHEGDPGPANVFPLPNPAGGNSSASAAPKPESAAPGGKVEADTGSRGGSGVMPWALGGLGVIVAAGAIVGFLVRRRTGQTI
ncbi:S8 family serine peptidase [Streptomyces sp. NPDC054933]